MSEVTEMLRDLQAGDATLDEVVTAFRSRTWPTATPPPPKDAAELAAREHGDRDPDPDGSFAEVAQAFYNGIITVDEYGALVQAVGTIAAAPPTEEAPEGEPEPEPDPKAEGDTDPAEEDTEGTDDEGDDA